MSRNKAAQQSNSLDHAGLIAAKLNNAKSGEGAMSRKMDFFNSLLDKTNKNIEVIALQLNEI